MPAPRPGQLNATLDNEALFRQVMGPEVERSGASYNANQGSPIYGPNYVRPEQEALSRGEAPTNAQLYQLYKQQGLSDEQARAKVMQGWTTPGQLQERTQQEPMS